MKIIATAFFCTIVAYSAHATPPGFGKKVKYRKTMPVFFEVGAGINHSKFIDFGTSPIYYSGSPFAITGALRKETDSRESCLLASYSTGSYHMDYNGMNTVSNVPLNLSLRYSRLSQLNVFNNTRWNFKIGATAAFTGMFRQNASLLNNAVGYNAFTNVMLSGKISRDISTRQAHKWAFFKLRPKSRKLSYQLDVGLINGAFSNGFIYTNSSAVYNEPSLAAAHTYKLLSGFRMASRLDYQFDISNRNTLKFSYLWDAMMTGNKDQSRFQLVNNILMLSLNFKMR